ncbi:MAG: hypothetical protein OEV61_07345 [Chloroflexota bacterium]|jgi:FtsH-binding integral membrane protein|nr:hypothetical protein [Chloroflexota bacterium]MDH5243110.1 hypothetical protein [Chloroflexota bacterium]
MTQRSTGRSSERRGRRLSPGVVFLTVALLASVAYVLYAITVRDASQIPLLASGAVVLAIVFAALTAYSFSATLRAGREGQGGRSLLIGLVGGLAAIATATCLAGAFILFQLAAG